MEPVLVHLDESSRHLAQWAVGRLQGQEDEERVVVGGVVVVVQDVVELVPAKSLRVHTDGRGVDVAILGPVIELSGAVGAVGLHARQKPDVGVETAGKRQMFLGVTSQMPFTCNVRLV